MEQIRSSRPRREKSNTSFGVHQDMCPNAYDRQELRDHAQIKFVFCERFTVGGWDGRHAHVRIMLGVSFTTITSYLR